MRLVERRLQLVLFCAKCRDQVCLLLRLALRLLQRDLRARQLAGKRLLLGGQFLQRRRVAVELAPELASPDVSTSDVEHSPKLYAYRCAPLVYSFVAGLSARKLSQLLGLYPLALVARLSPSRCALDARRASCADLEFAAPSHYRFCATRVH